MPKNLDKYTQKAINEIQAIKDKANQISPKPNNKKRKKLPKALTDAVWVKYMGNKPEGKCFCCKIRPIHFTQFEVGHVKAVAKGGSDDITNLRPICSSCNRSEGTMSMTEFSQKYFGSQLSKNKKGIGTSDHKITKQELLKSLSTLKLRKLTKELNIEVYSIFDPERDDFLDALLDSRKVTVGKINEILDL